MQEALPYSSRTAWPPASTSGHRVVDPVSSSTATTIGELVRENPVLVLGRRGCCMCHVVKRLLLGLGVNPAVCEIDGGDEEVTRVTAGLGGAAAEGQLPAVFIGGRLVGGLDRLVAVHISGELVPILKEAGALWL
ncbi:Monothiol glutaredoxin-S9 [Acorus gramineus]|uniref:Monothiol glutaredoxin-S9 n=1 Tax=Acorus gramineus TaxID=55184 RepID=A0AAV9B047_ACOGR|nr:Monothiol glutaredoxin-S9 [Acorus gramineus]